VSGVVKDSANPHFRNRYASLEAVIDAARPALQANGLAFSQAPGALVDGAIEITTMIFHTSGQWQRSTLHVPLTKKDAQGVGSALTYGCRFSLMAILGLPPVDDDGEAASRPAPARQDDAPAARPRSAPAANDAAQGPSQSAQNMAREVSYCRSQADLDALKKQGEFLAFWDEASVTDKKFVSNAATAAVARFAPREAVA